MRVKNVYWLLFVVLMLFHPLVSFAQGQDAAYRWKGNSINSVINSSDDDVRTFYLYNVKSGKYLYTGSFWGTSISVYRVGMPLKFEAATDGTYKIQGTISTENGKYLGFPTAGTLGNEKQVDFDRVYCDRGLKSTGDHVNWSMQEILSDGKVYYRPHIFNGNYTDPAVQALLGGDRYMKVKVDENLERNEIEYPSTPSADQSDLWQIITLKDLKDAFKDQFASNEDPADASFLISNQNFDISNAGEAKWKRTDGLTWKTPFPSNGKPYAHAFSPEESYSFFIGNRGVMADNYQRQYGQYWIASIRNVGNDNNANGKVTQTVTTLKKGWYRVSCDGFYNADNGSSIISKLFANVEGVSDGHSNVSAELNNLNGVFDYTVDDLTKTSTSHNGLNVADISPYIKASKLFETGNYNNSILVYVPTDGAQLNIGISVSNSTGDLDWTAFDNFQLKYCGNADMILDEGQTSIDYITKQVNPNYANTLILKRSMKPGIWNTITLPVALTAAQFKTAFGDQAKLSRLKGQSGTIPSRIDFEAVNLTKDRELVIEPGKLYIMKPMRDATVTSGSYSKTIAPGEVITVQAPYYTINNVVLAATPDEVFKETSKSSSTPDLKLQFCGTQIRQTSQIIPKYSYVLGGSNGKWYYTQSNLTVKGFRCWIVTGDKAEAKNLRFFIDGVEEDAITGINNVVTSDSGSLRGNVYTISGQLIKSNTESLDNLPKGIYIINGKKYIVQ